MIEHYRVLDTFINGKAKLYTYIYIFISLDIYLQESFIMHVNKWKYLYIVHSYKRIEI